MGNIVETVDDRIQNALLAAMYIVPPKVELVVRSMDSSSGCDVASATAISERGEQVEITAAVESVSDRDNTLHELNITDET